MNCKKKQNPVRYDGEFVLTSNGSKDFGEITPEIAKEIRRQAGKIRLRMGKQEGEKDNYGEKHIERPDRLQQLRDNGYENARDLVQDVAKNFHSIYAGRGSRLILYKKGKNDVMLYVELTPSEDSDFYDVKTGLITRKDFMNNQQPRPKGTRYVVLIRYWTRV
ncbi:MAG: hypothetical protein LBI28_06440 [Treponema sp.]|nr:hypothetical protein [Treponema sp.]